MPQSLVAREGDGRTRLPSQKYESNSKSNGTQSIVYEEATLSNGERKRKREAVEDPQEDQQASGSLEWKTMIELGIQERRQKRQRAGLEEQEDDVEEDEDYSDEEPGSEDGGSDADEESGIDEHRIEQNGYRE